MKKRYGCSTIGPSAHLHFLLVGPLLPPSASAPAGHIDKVRDLGGDGSLD